MNEQKEKIDWKQLKQDAIVAVKDKKRWLGFLIEMLIVGVFIAVDLLTKKYIWQRCEDIGDMKFIPGFIGLTAVKNTGAGFGLFSNKTVVLTIISCISAIAFIIFMFYSFNSRNKVLRSSLILITAGAIGNIVDRIWLGYVRDFINFEFMTFAVFNVADACLTVGMVLMVIYVLFFYSNDEKKKKEMSPEEVKREIARLLESEKTEQSQSEQKQEQEAPTQVQEAPKDDIVE